MTRRTLRERLAAGDAPPAVGARLMVGSLVRVTNPRDGRVGMTGEITRITGGYALVRFTAWGTSHVVALADIARVERERAA